MTKFRVTKIWIVEAISPIIANAVTRQHEPNIKEEIEEIIE